MKNAKDRRIWGAIEETMLKSKTSVPMKWKRIVSPLHCKYWKRYKLCTISTKNYLKHSRTENCSKEKVRLWNYYRKISTTSQFIQLQTLYPSKNTRKNITPWNLIILQLMKKFIVSIVLKNGIGTANDQIKKTATNTFFLSDCLSYL